LTDMQFFREGGLRAEVGDGVFGLHAPSIIGMPIRKRNRHANLFFGHHSRMEEKPATPGARIRHARKLRKMSQPQLAKAVGITQPSLSLIETGETKEISGPVLVSLCTTLDIRPQWVIAGQGQMEITHPGDLSYSAEETELVRNYRKMSPIWKSVLDSLPAMPEGRREEMLRIIWKQMTEAAGITPLPSAEAKKKRGSKS
jgi:transcriptional regulator with XRE-family HTH domain